MPPPATAQDGIEEVIEQRETVSALGELPSEDEVDCAIARAATEKSPGADGVPIEAFGRAATKSARLRLGRRVTDSDEHAQKHHPRGER